jgi:F0F1-type ATP synthase membrane subunit b/b'
MDERIKWRELVISAIVNGVVGIVLLAATGLFSNALVALGLLLLVIWLISEFAKRRGVGIVERQENLREYLEDLKKEAQNLDQVGVEIEQQLKNVEPNGYTLSWQLIHEQEKSLHEHGVFLIDTHLKIKNLIRLLSKMTSSQVSYDELNRIEKEAQKIEESLDKIDDTFLELTRFYRQAKVESKEVQLKRARLFQTSLHPLENFAPRNTSVSQEEPVNNLELTDTPTTEATRDDDASAAAPPQAKTES